MTPTNSEPFDGLVINGYGIYTPADEKALQALIDKQVAEALAHQREDIRSRLPEKKTKMPPKMVATIYGTYEGEKIYREAYNQAIQEITKILEGQG